jgi:hypothetical protein
LHVKNQWEKWRIKGTKFGHLNRGINNHLGLLDELQAKDGVDGDIASPCNKKACGVPLLCEVRKVEPECHRQVGGDRVAVMLEIPLNVMGE